jgi:transcriptional regulator with XRE-family HTH domain
MTLQEKVSQNVKRKRLAKQLSQEALAARASLSVSLISMVERGNRGTPLATIERIARALQVKPLELLQ